MCVCVMMMLLKLLLRIWTGSYIFLFSHLCIFKLFWQQIFLIYIVVDIIYRD